MSDLEKRLAAAEAVCVMFGWSPARSQTDREKAAYTLWRRWVEIVGSGSLSPERHPDLDEQALAREYDEHRANMLVALANVIEDVS
jgi:hypothetical protein